MGTIKIASFEMIRFSHFEWQFPKPEVPPIIQKAVGSLEKRWISLKKFYDFYLAQILLLLLTSLSLAKLLFKVIIPRSPDILIDHWPKHLIYTIHTYTVGEIFLSHTHLFLAERG